MDSEAFALFASFCSKSSLFLHPVTARMQDFAATDEAAKPRRLGSIDHRQPADAVEHHRVRSFRERRFRMDCVGSFDAGLQDRCFGNFGDGGQHVGAADDALEFSIGGGDGEQPNPVPRGRIT